MNDDGSGSAPDVGEDRPRLSASTVIAMRGFWKLDVEIQDLNCLDSKDFVRAFLSGEDVLSKADALDGGENCHSYERYNARKFRGIFYLIIIPVSTFVFLSNPLNSTLR